MTLWGFFVGLILGFFPVMYLLTRRSIRFIDNAYLRGALFGAGLWLLLNLLLYIEARFGVLGILKGEHGFNSLMILSSSLQGFLTAGLLAAFALKKIKKVV